MKLNRILPLTLLAAAACGGSASTNEFRANAPTFEKLAISQNDSDTAAAPATAAALTEAAATPDATTPDCHPHLFVRTGEIVERVNRHFRKHLHHVEELIENNPIADGQTKTWENVRDGIDRKFTMTRTANLDGSVTYTFELDLATVPASGTPTFVKVMSGSITHVGPADADDADAGAGALVENKGVVTFDFTALASVSTRERSSGQISDTFDNVHDPVKGVKRSASITLTNFLPEEGDMHGPRTGSYTWEREPGVGGKLQFQDTVTLFCLPNPTGAQSDVSTVARWYKAADGQVHGRTDAKASGGQLPAGDTWMGVTCAKGQTSSAPAEGFWMMKLEDSTGATVTSQSAQVGTEPCDPVFGAVPSATDNKTDYDFTAAVTFPGEW
jgi:hypothetical protein